VVLWGLPVRSTGSKSPDHVLNPVELPVQHERSGSFHLLGLPAWKGQNTCSSRSDWLPSWQSRAG